MLQIPGATNISRLKVYDTAAPDGQRGGTPHVHLICTELYIVVGGSGAVEMIDSGGFSVVELRLHDALLFTPGTIHRLINPHGDLEILVFMQNSGLPERGDNVVCFPTEWLKSDAAYAEAMQVNTLDDAYQRRDRGVAGFLELKGAFASNSQHGRAALEHFYTQALQRTSPYRLQWREIVQAGAVQEAAQTLNQLNALESHNLSHLMNARRQAIPAGQTSDLGFCGHLKRYFNPATLQPEGIQQT